MRATNDGVDIRQRVAATETIRRRAAVEIDRHGAGRARIVNGVDTAAAVYGVVTTRDDETVVARATGQRAAMSRALDDLKIRDRIRAAETVREDRKSVV